MPQEHKPVTIQDLYPDLTPEEQAEAEYNLKRYLQVVWRIYQRREQLPDDDIISRAIDRLID